MPPVTINGSTGIDKIQDGTVVDADIASLAASKLTGDLPAGMGGKVLQVVKVMQSEAVLTTATAYTDLTDSITVFTPVSDNSTIYIESMQHGYVGSGSSSSWSAVTNRILKDSTLLYDGSTVAGGSAEYNPGTVSTDVGDRNMMYGYACVIEGNTSTAPRTYKAQIASRNPGISVQVNHYAYGYFTITEIAN